MKIVRNSIDIAEIFKNLTGSKKSSLDYMCSQILKKKLCKFNQVSDWESRPLRKAQIHYAALDAVVVFELYWKMKKLEGFGDDVEYIDTISVK